MKPTPVSFAMKSIAPAALFCLLALVIPSTAGAQAPNPSANSYAVAGQQFLSQLQSAFLQHTPPKNPAGFPLDLYVGDINGITGAQQATDNAALFADENMIRALYWGAQVFPSQFKPLLATAIGSTTITSPTVGQLAWYNSTCSTGQPGFGTTRNATCFFDDNAQLAGTLMDIYLHVLPTADVYNDSSEALNFVLSNTDAQGGIPQTPADLGEGKFYMNPAVNSGQTDVNYGTAFGIPSDVAVGLDYFNEVNNPALGLINKNGLFIGGTTYDGNGVWTPNNVGALGGESSNVALLALALYRNTGNSYYLTYAENLVNDLVAQKVDPNGAVAQNAVNGGYAILDVLCQLYMTDHNVQYFNEAQAIVDFLLNSNRDTEGYFANGTANSSDFWDVVRTGMPASTDTVLLTQSAAAAAILEFAYVDVYYPPALGAGSVNLQTSMALSTASPGYSETLTVSNKGTAVAQTVIVNSATLGAAAGATFPALLGDIEPGASASVTLTFPASAGANNAPAIERVTGAYTGGTFGASFRTTLP